MPAPLPKNEAERIERLRKLTVLDSPEEEMFDNLTKLAAQICEVPIALISLVDSNRQWFKARVGLDAKETPRDLAFCAHAILGDDVMEIPDALEDERFRDNLLVRQDPKIRYYAGYPLVTSDGHGLGTLCVIDREPRQLTEKQTEALRLLGRQVLLLLELRSNMMTLRREAAALLTSASKSS